MVSLPLDGIEEVFTAVSESVSLSCSSTSSLRMGGSVTWAVGERPLTDDISPCKGRCHVNRDSSLVISKVSALHAGEYQCSESAERRKVLNRIWLHTLDGECERVCQRQTIKRALIFAPLQVKLLLSCLSLQSLQSVVQEEITSL